MCRSLKTDWNRIAIEIRTAAVFEQYENQQARFLQKYEKVVDMLPFNVDSLHPMKLEIISGLNRAKDVWKPFLSGPKFLMTKCKRLLRENDPATVIKPTEQLLRGYVNATGRIYPLELIDWNQFNESEMSNYIDRYEEEAKPQCDYIFSGKENPLNMILNDARQATIRPYQLGDWQNYQTLKVLVDTVNAVMIN